MKILHKCYLTDIKTKCATKLLHLLYQTVHFFKILSQLAAALNSALCVFLSLDTNDQVYQNV